MRTDMTFDEMVAALGVWDMALGCNNCGKADWGDNATEDPTMFHAEDCPLKGRRDVHRSQVNCAYVEYTLGRRIGTTSDHASGCTGCLACAPIDDATDYERLLIEQDKHEKTIADLSASRRESAALGAMVARLREALEPLWKYVRTKHGDWYMDAERREHANRIDAALALTPATVGAYVTALESTERIARRIWRADVRDAPQSTTDMEMEELESALAKVDAARALLSDRAPGKGNDK